MITDLNPVSSITVSDREKVIVESMYYASEAMASTVQSSTEKPFLLGVSPYFCLLA